MHLGMEFDSNEMELPVCHRSNNAMSIWAKIKASGTELKNPNAVGQVSATIQLSSHLAGS